MMSTAATILCSVALSTTSVATQTWSGIYRKANGDMVGIGEFHEFGPSQILVDYQTGDVGPLLALPDGRTGIGRRSEIAVLLLRGSWNGKPAALFSMVSV